MIDLVIQLNKQWTYTREEKEIHFSGTHTGACITHSKSRGKTSYINGFIMFFCQVILYGSIVFVLKNANQLSWANNMFHTSGNMNTAFASNVTNLVNKEINTFFLPRS